jgi:hypothetical protein
VVSQNLITDRELSRVFSHLCFLFYDCVLFVCLDKLCVGSQLFQIAWYCKLYPKERALLSSCPVKDGLPSDGRNAKVAICQMMKELAPIMDDLSMVCSINYCYYFHILFHDRLINQFHCLYCVCVIIARTRRFGMRDLM